MNSEFVLILKAASFAAAKHRGQLRKDAESTAYINHPLEVARILVEEGGVSDPEIIAAALLHDTIEDTKTTQAELASIFGDRVALMVAEVTDDKSITDKAERKRLQVINAPHKSVGAALVKLADKTANVRDVGSNPAQGWSDARRLEYLDWAQRVVDVLPVKEHPLNAVFQQSWSLSRSLVGKPKRFASIRCVTDKDHLKATDYSVGTFHRAPNSALSNMSSIGEQPSTLDLLNLAIDPAKAAGEFSDSMSRNQLSSSTEDQNSSNKGEQ